MQSFKSVIYLLLETEKNLNKKITEKETHSVGTSHLIIEKCHDMLISFLNILMKDDLKFNQYFNEIENLDHNKIEFYFIDNMNALAQEIFDKSSKHDLNADLIDEISRQIISLRFKYLSFKSSNTNLFF